MNPENSEFAPSQSKIGIYPINFNTYIKLVNEEDFKAALQIQLSDAEKFLNTITEEQSFFKYAEEKWTIKEVLQHVIDAERIFAYRALAFARKDKNTLPSFNENEYAVNASANSRSWKELIEEFISVRKSNLFLFNSFTEENLKTTGKASDYTVSVKALGYITIGHVRHHLNILREKYMVK